MMRPSMLLELNSSQCEDFPLPEHENEVVQIPTNEDDNPKMAIIRMFKNQEGWERAGEWGAGSFTDGTHQKDS